MYKKWEHCFLAALPFSYAPEGALLKVYNCRIPDISESIIME